MGQVQRRERHQDVELWELDREDRREGIRGGRDRDAARDRGSKRAVSSGKIGGGRNAAVARRTDGSRNAAAVRKADGSRNAAAARRIDEGGDMAAARRIDGSRSAAAVRRSDGNRHRNVAVREDGSRGEAAVRRSGEGRHSAAVRRNGSAGRSVSYLQPYPSIAGQGRGLGQGYRGNARPVQSIKRRRARRRKAMLRKAMVGMLMVLCLALIYVVTGQIYQMTHRHKTKTEPETPVSAAVGQLFDHGSRIAPPEIIQDLLEINEYSRPGDRLERIDSIFVHYTANPGTSAAQNRSYFANLAQTHERSASAHLIIGYDGELIQCIPFDEQAYAVMTRNEDSISIECCYLSEDGSFTQETYDTLIHTLAWLLDEYDLSTEDILRHYDCGGKLCPLYYAENEDAWEQLLRDVAAYMDTAGDDMAEAKESV